MITPVCRIVNSDCLSSGRKVQPVPLTFHSALAYESDPDAGVNMYAGGKKSWHSNCLDKLGHMT